MIIYISRQALKKLSILTSDQVNELFEIFLETTPQDKIKELGVNAKGLVAANLDLTRKNKAKLDELSTTINKHKSQLGAIITTHMLGANGLESYYQLKLQKYLGGIREVPVPSGRIDLVTSTHVIECKMASKWKAAIGQAIAYHVYKPGLIPAIALIGHLGGNQGSVVHHVCRNKGIDVIWMNENGIDVSRLTPPFNTLQTCIG